MSEETFKSLMFFVSWIPLVAILLIYNYKKVAAFLDLHQVETIEGQVYDTWKMKLVEKRKVESPFGRGLSERLFLAENGNYVFSHIDHGLGIHRRELVLVDEEAAINFLSFNQSPFYGELLQS